MSDDYRSFISKVMYYHELNDSNKVKIWVKKYPTWLPRDQPLYLITSEFKADTLKGMYYFPGKLQFFVDSLTFEIHKIKYVINNDGKCMIL